MVVRAGQYLHLGQYPLYVHIKNILTIDRDGLHSDVAWKSDRYR